MLASNFCPWGEFGLELLVLLPMPPVYCNYNHTAYHTVFYFLSDKQVVLDTKILILVWSYMFASIVLTMRPWLTEQWSWYIYTHLVQPQFTDLIPVKMQWGLRKSNKHSVLQARVNFWKHLSDSGPPTFVLPASLVNQRKDGGGFIGVLIVGHHFHRLL